MDIILYNIPAKAHVDLERWAKITIEKWQFNLVQKKLVYSGDLLRSFEHAVHSDANGDYALISFAFKYYFRMLDMGVHKGKDFVSSQISGKARPKVFLRTFYSELYRLSELVAEKYAINGAFAIVDNIHN